jgi:hypothetical protein
MISARRRALVIAIVAVIILAALALALMSRAPASLPPRPVAQRPPLLLLTSLPLLFSADFSLAGGSPAVKRIEERYKLEPINVTDPRELAKGRLLFMAHPLAQPAEDLVALDDWVRKGGKVLLLADPMLEWPSNRPLGDPLRPPPMFADTGLLAHWGLRLDAPDTRGPATRKLGGFDVMTVSPGSLSGTCSISSDGLVAHCKVGKGVATVVADADMLNTDALGKQGRHNVDAILVELATLEHE